MAIGTDAGIDFYGTQDDLASSSASVSDGNFSIASDLAEWTNDDDAPEASFILEASWATETSIAGLTLDLYAQVLNIEGATNDAKPPSSDNTANFLGVFVVPAEDASDPYFMPLGPVRLPSQKASQEYAFFIKNNSGQTIAAGWTLHVTPISIGPHA